MSYDKARYECEYCGQKFMASEIRKYHEIECKDE